MTLATRIRTADPLAGGLPDELLAPVAPDDGGTRPPAGRGRRARRGAVLGAALAAAVVVAALILAVAALRPAAPARGVSATFVALSASGDGAPPALVDVSVGIVRDRLDTLGVRGWAVAGAGGARIRVSCAGCDKRTDLAVARTVARRGRLLVYDWERDVLDPQCRARPADPDVTGGPVAGTAGSGDSTSYYGAVVRAARCPARRYAGMSRTAAAYYGVDPARRSVLAGPETSASAARAASRTPHVRIVRVAPGATVVGADDDTTPPPAPNDAAWYACATARPSTATTSPARARRPTRVAHRS